MSLRNRNVEREGLPVTVDQEAYPGMFDGSRSPLIKGLRGTIVQLPGEDPMVEGAVKIRFDDPSQTKRVSKLWPHSGEEQWFLSGALSERCEDE